ncbi:hypothetical protein SDC9_107248 [bioreactor metagenome]|uniref:Uncharacterized protein n=1 Tax=bioreactor metagenome TaxID=1076179 RepID=A0A645B4T0_9ZZZZ
MFAAQHDGRLAAGWAAGRDGQIDVAEPHGGGIDDGDRQQVSGAEEVGYEGGARCAVNLLGGTQLLDVAAVQQGDPVAHGERLALVMGDEDHRRADPALQLAKLGLHLVAQLGVQIAQRLVEQQHAGLVGQCPGQGDPLLLAAGELPGAASGIVCQPHQVEHLIDAGGLLGFGNLAGLQPVGDILGDRQMREQRVVLEDQAEITAVGRGVGDIASVDDDLTCRWLHEAGDHIEQSRLAAA